VLNNLRRKPADLSLEERSAAASALAASAVSAFESAASDLVEAAAEQDVVAAELHHESDRLFDEALAAESAARKNRTAASKMLDLIGLGQ
jgi:hypothetical protein